MTVAILCAAPSSVYHRLEGLEVYDRKRDARNYRGPFPIVAHPPCRAFSATCRHQALPEPGEVELAHHCVAMLRRFGGVLEQPAYSHLFTAAAIPRPGEAAAGGVWSTRVDQNWFGDDRQKKTWLAFFHIEPAAIEIPFALRAGKRSTLDAWNRQSSVKREATSERMARWLIDAARNACGPG